MICQAKSTMFAFDDMRNFDTTEPAKLRVSKPLSSLYGRDGTL